MARDIDPFKVSSPRIFLVRMLVFLVLCSLVMVVLYKQIIVAFFANPGLNALIGAVLLIGIILSFRQVIRHERPRCRPIWHSGPEKKPSRRHFGRATTEHLPETRLFPQLV